ncbi:MAG: B12-binding domain-containing radical SAM protein [bacterium]|nr:B12-binding domain-containing radical SAM protein [bacterium]
MQAALISIGNCPSLASRNIRRFCLAHDDVREEVELHIFDYDLTDFRTARPQSALRWSFVSQFDETVRDLLRIRPALIGFSCYLWSTETSLHVAHLIKQVLPETLTVFGGPDAGPRATELLERHPQVDVVVEGDGEIPVLGLLRSLLTGSPALADIPQLRYRDGDLIARNAASDELLDMSRLVEVWDPPPARSEMGRWGWPYLLYETLRGCPYACSYCMYGKTPMNAKDPELVVEELVGLLRTGQAVELIDPTFTTYVKRAKRILRDLVRHEYSGTLTFEAYPDSLDEEMVDLISRARVSCIGIGFQTLSAEGLKAVKRPKNLPRFERAIRLLREHGINYYVDLIYGLPKTSKEDFFATVDYLYTLEVENLMIYRLLGLPGSPMMDDAEEHALVFSEIPPYEMLSSATFTLDDVVECEEFQYAYNEVLGALPSRTTRRLAQAAGGVSNLILRYVEGGYESPAAFRETLTRAGQWPADPVLTVA